MYPGVLLNTDNYLMGEYMHSCRVLFKVTGLILPQIVWIYIIFGMSEISLRVLCTTHEHNRVLDSLNCFRMATFSLGL